VEWDLGLQAVVLVVTMSLGFGALAALLVGSGPVSGSEMGHRLRWLAITSGAWLAVGLFTSEVWFGWATEEDLQPNIDGLSFDEVFLSGVVTTVLTILVARAMARRAAHRAPSGASPLAGRHR
jgi:hypothetical protein